MRQELRITKQRQKQAKKKENTIRLEELIKFTKEGIEMKVILNYDESTGQITDMHGMVVCTWMGLNYEELSGGGQSDSMIDGEQLIRIMKMSAHIEDADKIKDL
jgi:hypothetical protein